MIYFPFFSHYLTIQFSHRYNEKDEAYQWSVVIQWIKRRVN
jgi:hypothetical protein